MYNKPNFKDKNGKFNNSNNYNNKQNNSTSRLNKEKLRDQENEEIESYMGINWLKQGQEITGYLVNMKSHKYKANDDPEKEDTALLMYFIDEAGESFKAIFPYEPYLFVISKDEKILPDLQQTLLKKLEGMVTSVEIIDKVDLEMLNHLSGKKMKLLKIKFKNLNCLYQVRNILRPIVQKNKAREQVFSYNELLNPTTKLDFLDYLSDLREDDVPYHVRVCIDSEIRCGTWYQVKALDEGCDIKPLYDKFTKPDIRILAFDIETTKAPLKFPDPTIDSVMMISYMINGQGFLINNRSIISEDIDDFDYSPKPDFEGNFRVFNEPDEKAVLLRFAEHVTQTRINVFVTYNGDFFDLPFLEERYKVHGLKMETQIGLINTGITGLDKEYTGRYSTHIDCLYWVKRDSFLPQGSHGLKAVTKNKLGYDPIEVDPENMVRFAREKPQQLCAYSVSDALSTYYIYKLMIHDFVFALCTIIPTFPDEVLRKGSGTLCEELLMAQAYRRNILFPNKQVDNLEKFHEGHFIDNETYIGGHVECINEGVFRHDIPVRFHLEIEAYKYLESHIEDYMQFCCEIENKTPYEDIENKEEVIEEIKNKLQAFISLENKETYNRTTDIATLDTNPLIYHLDVGAMYPNIILTNKLQPVSIVNDTICSSCLYNNPANECKKPMAWKWKGELFPLNRNEYESLKNQFEFELLNNYSNEKALENLSIEEHKKLFIKRIKTYCQKAYKQVHVNKIETKEDIVCMRENSFYVDTVRDFRDRRYEFKAKVKFYKTKASEAKEQNDFIKFEEAKNLVDLYESLQIAHKVVLNSFYGYVMRKGARWFSMEMAAMVTNTGSQIIMNSREFVEKVGTPLELDTDGIWALLPKGFPENFNLKTKKGKKINFSFPCTMLNHLIYDKYSNLQYQYLNKEDEWEMKKEMSIFFEVDGPYACMMIPASKEEGKKLKKRYAVFNFNGKLKELKGFELKRRGELKIIKIFQEQVFGNFLKGNSLSDCYKECAKVADNWYKILENKGEGITDDDLLEYIEETKIISKVISEYGNQKSTSLTCARRQAELLGLKDISREKGVCVNYIISKKPEGASVAERAIPIIVFQSDPKIKEVKLRSWLKDFTAKDLNMKEVIDWDYYKERLASTILKIIIIPAAIQKVENPLTKIKCPDWVNKLLKEKFKTQQKLSMFFGPTQRFASRNLNFGVRNSASKQQSHMIVEEEEEQGSKSLHDIEDLHQSNFPNKSTFKSNNNITTPYKSNKKDKKEEEEIIENVSIFENFDKFLYNQKKKWNNLIKEKKKNKDNELSTSGKKNLNNPFGRLVMNSKEDIFKRSILKIYKVSEDRFNPGHMLLWVVFNGNMLERIAVKFKRRIYLHTYQRDLSSLYTPITNMKLPRNKPVKNLYAIDIDEKEYILKKNLLNEYLMDKSIEGIYESNIPLTHHAIVDYGSQIKLKKHIAMTNFSLNTHVFNYHDFEFINVESSHIHMENFTTMHLYFSSLGSRAVLVLFVNNKITKPEFYIFIVSSVKNQDVPNVKTIIKKTMEQNFELRNNIFNDFDFKIKTFLETDLKKAVQGVREIVISKTSHQPSSLLHNNKNKNNKITYDNINEIINNEEPILPPVLLVQCEKREFRQLLNLDHIVPTVELPYDISDNEYPGLDWIKFAIMKYVYRLIEMHDLFSIRLNVSNYSNIPLCNVDKDFFLYSCDVIFSRMLRQNNTLLWYSDSIQPNIGGGDDFIDYTGEIGHEVPIINNSGMYLGYTADLHIGMFAINAIKTAHHLQNLEGNSDVSIVDPNKKSNNNDEDRFTTNTYSLDKAKGNYFHHLERDEFTLGSGAFHMIIKFIERILHDVDYQFDIAEYLIAHIYRWISTPTSKFYDPVVHRMINKIMQKNFAIFIKALKEVNFNVLYADTKRILISNNKTNLLEFQNNIEQLVLYISNKLFFSHLSITVNAIWKVLLYKDMNNYSGVLEHEEIEEGVRVFKPDREEEIMQVVNKWNIIEFLPPVLEQDFISFMTDYLSKQVRFVYYKDYILVRNLVELFESNLLSEEFIKKIQNYRLNMINAEEFNPKNYIDDEELQEMIVSFKVFLVKCFVQNKLLTLIPTIIKKEDQVFDDYERENQALNYSNIKTKSNHMIEESNEMNDINNDNYDNYSYDNKKKDNYLDEGNYNNEFDETVTHINKLYSRRDFEGFDYDDEASDDYIPGAKNIVGLKNKKRVIDEDDDINLLLNKDLKKSKEDEHFIRWNFREPLGSYQEMKNPALEYVKVSSFY